MKRYDSYKDSGVKWIGEIPSHWKRCRNKDIMRERKDIVGDKANKYTLLSLTMNGVIIRDISEGKGKFPKDFTTYKIVRPGQMVFCLFDIEETPRTVGLVKNEGMLTGAYDVFDLHNVNGHYLYYYYESIDDRKALKPLYRGLRKTIPTPTFMSMSVYLPPLPEQRAIVSFLDTELGKIDTYMDKEQQLIERLKELKQSLIARAVTHGIDPNVKMKPSGINWIGEIPEHWKVKRLSQVATEYFVSNKMVHHQNLLSLSYGKIVRKNINTTEGLLPASFDNYQVVDDGIIVLRLTDLQNDHKSLRVGLAHEEGIVTSAYLSIKPRENITSEYLYEQLHCNDLHKVFYGMGDGLRQSLNWQGLKNLPMAVPPLTEQRAIVDYISSATSKIDKLISEKTKEMEYMKELRQRIISDAVTGKIDVRS